MRVVLVPVLVAFFLSGAGVSLALAQEARYADEPTSGVHLPSTRLAGENDATTVTVNPAGLGLLRGKHVAFALDLARKKGAPQSGPGVGLFYASALGGRVFPKVGWGVALEWLRPQGAELLPDPGTPVRMTLGGSVPLGKNSAMGLSWHHFFDSATLGGLDTIDLGWTSRFNAQWAAGVVIRDVGAPQISGGNVRRRYEAEIINRPLGTDWLELGLGGRLGERNLDLAKGHAMDAWAKWSFRLARGVFLRGELGSNSLQRVVTTEMSTTQNFLRDTRLSVGLEFSLGTIGAAAYGNMVRNGDGDTVASGGTFVARLSQESIPSMLPQSQRIERLELKGPISEERLLSIVVHLRRLAKDDAVVGLFLNISGVVGGWAALHEIRREITGFRNAKKHVFAYLAEGGTADYFVASAATKVYVDPAGGIRLQGFSGTSLYFAGLFEKIGVKAQFERIEEYKSAPEAFTRSGPTEPAFRMRNELYDSIYATIIGGIARSRGISRKRVRAILDEGPYTAGDLEKRSEIVDRVIPVDKLPSMIAKEMGYKYPYGSRPNDRKEFWEYRKIAIVYIEGDIVGGKSRGIPLLGRTLVGGETIAKAVAAANADDSIEAIVLRINSPGGSALASDLMAREVKKVRGNKPIICSLGNVAASGGYFAAAYCDRIFADPMTITGSIGIFNGGVDISGLLKKLGLSWTTYKRGKHSDLGGPYRPMSEEESKFVKSKLYYYYNRFIAAVAEGRKMTTKAVDGVGRGHVWTGTQGLRIRLVDELGGVIDAINYAKRQAGFAIDEKASLVLLPKKKKSILSQVLGSGPLGTALGESQPPSGGAYWQQLGVLLGSSAIGTSLLNAIPGSVWSEPGVPQARLPFAILWH